MALKKIQTSKWRIMDPGCRKITEKQLLKEYLYPALQTGLIETHNQSFI